MTDANGAAPPPAPRDEYHADLDAERPVPLTVTFKGRTWSIWRFEDIAIDDALAVCRLETQLDTAKRADEIIGLYRSVVHVLAPDVPDDVLGTLSTAEAKRLCRFSMGAPPNPRRPSGEARESISSSTSPAPLGFTVGVDASSGP